MSRQVALQNPSGSEFQDEKHIKELKSGRDRHQEVASDDRVRVIAHESHPAL